MNRMYRIVTVLAVLITFVTILTGCGGNSPTNPIITGTPTPTPVPSGTPTPGPTPTPGTNTLTFISAYPPPGSTLNIGDKVTVTVGYTALQSVSILVSIMGSGSSGGGGTGPRVMGTGTTTAWATLDGPGTSTSLRIRMSDGGSEIFSITVPATYVWVGEYKYKLSFVSANPPSGSTLKVGTTVSFTLDLATYRVSRLEVTFNPLGMSCFSGSNVSGEGKVTFAECTSPKAGVSTSVTIGMRDFNSGNLLISTDVPLTYTWQ